MSDAIQDSIGYKATYGFTALTGGVHTGLDSKLLSPSQLARAINCTTRGGLATTRPAFQKVVKLGSGKFQGCGVLTLDERDWLVCAIDGKLKYFDGTMKDLGGTLSATVNFVYFLQAYRWLVAQDGTSRPVVIEEKDGALVRLARDAELEPTSSDTRICLVPGTLGLYAHGRIHYVPSKNPTMEPALEETEDKLEYTDASINAIPTPSDETGKTGFVSSDILDTLNPYKLFQMTEHRSFSEGGMFALTGEHGFVNGMAALRGASTGTGVGALFVFGSRGVSGFDISLPRQSTETIKGWQGLSFSQVAYTGVGTRSPFSLVNVNDDIWYVDSEKNLRSLGYDSMQLSAGNSGSVLYNTSKSFESKRWVELTSDAYRPYISSALSNNRLFWTLCDGRAIGSVDFAQTYTASPSEIPILHEGIWTGFDFKRILTIDGALHAVVAEDGDLWLLKLEGDKDLGTTPIEMEVVTPSTAMMYNEVWVRDWYKKLTTVEMQLSGITQPTSVEVFFRPSTYPVWTSLGKREFFVPTGSPPQSRTGIQFIPDYSATTACNPVDKTSLYFANYFQFKIVVVGRATIDMFRVYAQRVQEPPSWQCEVDNVDGESFPIDSDDDLRYSVRIGDPT